MKFAASVTMPKLSDPTSSSDIVTPSLMVSGSPPTSNPNLPSPTDSSPSPSSSSSGTSSAPKGVSAGMIAGIAVGAAVLAAIITALAGWMCFRYKRKGPPAKFTRRNIKNNDRELKIKTQVFEIGGAEVVHELGTKHNIAELEEKESKRIRGTRSFPAELAERNSKLDDLK